MRYSQFGHLAQLCGDAYPRLTGICTCFSSRSARRKTQTVPRVQTYWAPTIPVRDWRSRRLMSSMVSTAWRRPRRAGRSALAPASAGLGISTQTGPYDNFRIDAMPLPAYLLAASQRRYAGKPTKRMTGLRTSVVACPRHTQRGPPRVRAARKQSPALSNCFGHSAKCRTSGEKCGTDPARRSITA